MKNFHLVSIIFFHLAAYVFVGPNYAFAMDSDAKKVKAIRTVVIYTNAGDSEKKEVSGVRAACELYIKDECSINDCTDRNWQVKGEPEIKGTYVYCEYTGQDGIEMQSSPAVVELICPANAETLWDGEASYCSCLPYFIAHSDECVAEADTAAESSKSLASEEASEKSKVAEKSEAPEKSKIKHSDITQPKGETTAESDARHAAEHEQYRKDGGEISTKRNAENHHIASNKDPEYLPIFQEILTGAGLHMNHNENLVRIKNHGGKHGKDYHKAILQRFEEGLLDKSKKRMVPGTPEYIAAVRDVLKTAKADLLRPGSPLNQMVTKK